MKNLALRLSPNKIKHKQPIMAKQKKINLIVLFLVFLFVGKDDANGCSCTTDINSLPCGAYWSSDAVFIGLAEKVLIENQQTKVIFAVEKFIRGDEQKTIEIFTNTDGGGCGYPFEEGEQYFVYSKRQQDGKLTVHLCGRTALLRDAKQSLEFAKDVEMDGRITRLYGNVYQRKQENIRDSGSNIPVANVEITAGSILNPEKMFKTKTNKNGFYIFKNIPPSLYQLKADFPNGMRESDRQGLGDHYVRFIENRSLCYAENFFGTTQGYIKGRIINDNHFNQLQQQISLVPIDEEGKAVIEYAPFQETWAKSENGEFLFKSVPAGKYFISINPKNCADSDSQNLDYGRTFLPGVSSESQAKIITVREHQQTVTEDFRLLPPRKERWFSGIVLASNKTPVANATVFITVRYSKECFVPHRLREVETDKTGRFKLKGYQGYHYQIGAYTGAKNRRRSSKLFEVPLKSKAENIELIIDPPY